MNNFLRGKSWVLTWLCFTFIPFWLMWSYCNHQHTTHSNHPDLPIVSVHEALAIPANDNKENANTQQPKELVIARQDKNQITFSLPPTRERRVKSSKALNSSDRCKPKDWDLSSQDGILQRRACVQQRLFDAIGLDRPEAYFVQGCDYPPLYEFEQWAGSSCCGSEPVSGVLEYHTAWTGPYEHVKEDLEALFDSFLATQNLQTSRFTFWLIETDPNEKDPLQRKYGGVANNVIQFRRADLAKVAEGTPMEGNQEFVDLDWTAVKKGPRWRANLFRIMLLYKHGGIWVDTDTLFLRDLRPMYEFAGEFATKLTMSHYYNNNLMGLRKQSSLGRRMIEDIVATPFQRGERHYCHHVGHPCYPKWTWNHGLIQLAVREERGIVVYPTQFSDPAYACFPPYLLAKSGGFPMHQFTIEEVMEFIRGAFVLHTRAYNSDKPINKHSNYGKLYKIAKQKAKTITESEQARNNDNKNTFLVNIGARNQTRFEDLLLQRGDKANVVDPAFIPPGGSMLVVLRSVYARRCVDAVRHVKGQSYGGFPTLQLTGNCEKARTVFNETATLLYHEQWGYIRPSHAEPGRVLCMDAMPINILPPKDGVWSMSPQFITCQAKRPSQRWRLDNKRIRNDYSNLCLQPGPDSRQLTMKPCGDSSQRMEILPFVGDIPQPLRMTLDDDKL